MASDIDPTSSNFQYEAWLRARYVKEGTFRPSSMSVAWRDLNVHGYGAATDYQKTFINYPGAILRNILSVFTRTAASKISILEDSDGEVKDGEMLLVLGRPGSGCSTFLKTIAGQTKGFRIGNESSLNYQGTVPGASFA
jgi:ATP-binding cassette subfamily G (WHITE) protein 2 (PDR)